MVSCLGSLVQWCCGERGTLQTNITGVCGACSQCLSHTGFAPAHRVCFPTLHCSGFRLLCREWALGCMHFPGLSCSGSGSWVVHKGTDLVGHAVVPVPGPTHPSDHESTVPGELFVLITSLVPDTWFPGCTARALSQGCCVSPLGS